VKCIVGSCDFDPGSYPASVILLFQGNLLGVIRKLNKKHYTDKPQAIAARSHCRQYDRFSLDFG
jgi:hypothetical protein